MNNKLDAKASLCWRCKYGITVQEQVTEQVYTDPTNMRGIGGDIPGREEEEGFPIDFGEQIGEPDEPDIIEHTVEQKHVKTVCYWRPEGVEHSPPIGLSIITQCSRFKARDDQ